LCLLLASNKFGGYEVPVLGCLRGCLYTFHG
jgi:hypothetical protein